MSRSSRRKWLFVVSAIGLFWLLGGLRASADPSEDSAFAVDQSRVIVAEGSVATNGGTWSPLQAPVPTLLASIGEISVDSEVRRFVPGGTMGVPDEERFPQTRDLALADLDGDGDLDAVFDAGLKHQVWFNDGSGFFEDSGQRLDTVGGPILLGDLTGDGRPDALISRSPWIWRNYGGTLLRSGSLPFSSDSYALGDLDEDGDLDVVAADSEFYVLVNDGSGRFEVGFSDQPYLTGVRLADLDGDGDLDTLHRGSPGKVRFQTAPGQFGPPTEPFSGSNSSYYDDAKIGDVDGDGDPDVLFVGIRGCSLWHNDGQGWFVKAQDLAIEGADDRCPDAELIDVNGDGDLDAVLLPPASFRDGGGIYAVGAARVWSNDGSGHLVRSEEVIGRIGRGLVRGDLDGNGIEDLVFVDPRPPTLDPSEPGYAPNAVWLSGAVPWYWSTSVADDTEVPIAVEIRAGSQSDPPVGSFDLVVDNVAPTWLPPPGQRVLDPGACSIALGSFSDPGEDGPWEVSVDWGDDTPADAFTVAEPGPLGTRTYECQTPGINTATVRVAETGNAVADTGPLTVTVGNGAPVLAVDQDPLVVPEGSLAVNSGSLVDPEGDPAELVASSGATEQYHDVLVQGPVFTQEAQDVAIADLNGDGMLDVVFLHPYVRPSVWLNEGAGQSWSEQYTRGAWSAYGRSLAMGDWDADGVAEPLVATSEGVFVFDRDDEPILIGDEDPVPLDYYGYLYAFGRNAVENLALGDLDGDGDLDAVCATPETSATFDRPAANTVYLNEGGWLVDSGQLLGDQATRCVALGDLDGDGDLDAVFAHVADPDEVWFNDGSGIFTDAGQRWSTYLSESVALGDLDSDGDLDALVLADGQGRIWLNDGRGEFSELAGAALDVDGVDVALEDLDRDGDLDALIAVRDAAVQWWSNDGRARFRDSLARLGGPASTVATADLDGDGYVDAALSNGQILFGKPAERLWRWSLPTADGPDDSIRIELTASDGESSAIADFQLDVVNVPPAVESGEEQLFVPGELTVFLPGSFTDPGADGPWTVTVNWGDGTSTDFEQASPGTLPGVSHVYETASDYTVVVEVAETEGAAAGSGGFVATTQLDPAVRVDRPDTEGIEGTTALVTGRVWDPAGLPVALSVSLGEVELLQGPPLLEEWVAGTNTAPDFTTGVALGDFDRDGRPDVAFSALTGYPSGVLFQTTDPFPRYDQVDLSVASDSWDVAVGDLDGDGASDLYFANNGPDEVWLNDGRGALRDSGQRLGSGASRDVRLGDLDGDGDLDAFTCRTAGGPNLVWLNDGAGQFFSNGQQLGSSKSQKAALGDLDRDGDLDALVANKEGPNTVWFNDGNGMFADSGQRIGDVDTTGVALGDLDGDGDLDAFLANGADQDVEVPNEVWRNDGNGTFTDTGQRLGNGASTHVLLLDMDFDDDLDAFVVNWGVHELWQNDGAGGFSLAGTIEYGPYNGWYGWDGALGDWDGDGSKDVFVAGLSPLRPLVQFRNRGAGWLWSVPLVDGPALDTVSITARNSAGRTATSDLRVSVLNAPPAYTGPAAQRTFVGLPRPLELGSFVDPGVDAPWQVEVDWADGRPADSFTVESPGPIPAQVHVYDSSRTYTVDVRIEDDDRLSGYGEFLISVCSVAPIDRLAGNIAAPDRDRLVWSESADVLWVRGELSNVADYLVQESGEIAAAHQLELLGTPEPGSGWYYLVRPGNLCGSWQSPSGEEPDRDIHLP